MQIIKNRRVIPCDIDETLIMHIRGLNPHDEDVVSIYDPVENRDIHVKMNLPMIRLVKDELYRGSFLLVWSRSEYAWAAAVIEELGLEHENMIILSKPYTYFDDKDVSEWLKDRIYLTPDTVYKP